jgi:hypothetical protein
MSAKPAARPVPRPVIRAARAALIGLDGQRVAVVTMVVDDRLPEIVMFEGEPYLTSRDIPADASAAYVQVHPYRADAMVIEEPAR